MVVNTPITVAPEEDNNPIWVTQPEAPTLPPSPDVADTRSQKAYIGLGEATGQQQADMYQQIKNGQEQNLREAAAAHLTSKANEALQQKLIDARAAKGDSLSIQEAVRIVDPFNTEFGAADPHDVIEKAYSQKFISMYNTAAAYMKQTVADDATRDIPEQQLHGQSQMSDLSTRMEIARTMAQDNEDVIKNQSYLGWGVNLAETMFQPYNEVMMRGLNPEASGFLLGESLKNQADQLFNRPLEDYKKGLQSVKEQLKSNPLLFRQFMSYVIGQSTSDRRLDDIFTILTPFDYAAGLKLSRSLVRTIDTYNRSNTAFKQILKESAKTTGTDVPVKAVVQEAMGDVHGAAVTRAAVDVEKSIRGTADPIVETKAPLTSNFRLDGDILDSRPGTLSNIEVTKLKDGFYESGMKLYNALVDVLRVNRTPVPLQSEEAIRAYQTAARKNFPQDEGVLDIGSPIHHKETNTYWIPFTFGNSEGRLFSDADTAYNYARSRGYADPRIVGAEGTVEKEAGKLVGSPSDLRNKARLEKSIPVTEDFLKKRKDEFKSFVGPRTPEQITAAKDEITSVGNILKGYREMLENINKRVTTTEPVIEQHGLGHKFTVWRPYNETDPAVRSYLLSAKEARPLAGVTSWKNSVLGYIRSADDTLALNESIQRKVATYTQTVIKQWAQAEADKIQQIANQTHWYTPWTWHRKFTRKEMFDQFNETLDFARSAKDPGTGENGYFFKTPGEIQDHYSRYYGRLPSMAEIEAYFAHVKLVEGNRVLSEIAEFRNRARLGAEQHQIFLRAGQGSGKLASGYFDGVQRNSLPSSSDMVVLMGPNRGDEIVKQGRLIPTKTREKWEEAIRTGKAKVIEVYSVGSNPLQGFIDYGKNIRYIVTTDSEAKPLALNHINRRGGGHYEYDYEHYVKQADILTEDPGNPESRKIYNGDKTFMAVSNRAMGENFAKKMTQLNEYMKNGQTPEAQAHAKSMGIDWAQVEKWYDKDNPVIDWHEPFYAVRRNHRIYDIDKTLEDRVGKKQFVDAAKSGSLDKQFQVEYSQARDAVDLMEARDVGTQGNPIYKLSQAEKMDPIPTMTRALNRAIRSTFMDDYKIHAVEHWLREARPYMKAEKEEIDSAPFYYFHNADVEGAFKSDTSDEIKSNLMSNRFKIKQFLGMPNVVETKIHSLTQKLADDFYNKYGPEDSRSTTQKLFTIVPLNMLSRWQDPISGIRSFAFNAKLGVFSIPQFFVQAQTFANIWAIGGRDAAHGTMATMLHTWSRINKSDGFMRAYDDLYSKLGAKTGEFIEANRELAKTGFEHVGGEYQLADDQLQHNFFKGEFGNFLDAGQVFFREGEKATRLGAWYTAFREFRRANPTKVLTDVDRAALLQKADLYTANMSRASASAINSSVWSLPMQFLSYQVRMAELFWGKRLGETTAERAMARARLLGVYSALYGVPGAMGISGYPWGDMFREAAINKGYVPGDSQWQDGLMNGLVAWQMALITGKGDYQKGQQYDVQGRWGTQGFTSIREAMRSDHSIISLLAGAGPSTIFNTAAAVMDPFWQMANQWLSPDDGPENKFRVTPAHLAAMFGEVSSIDSAIRGIYAIHSGRWLAHNESYTEDVTPSDVLIREITGWKSQDQADILTYKNIAEAEKTAQKAAGREIIKDFRRGLDAAADKDYDSAQQYMTNARARATITGMPIEKRAELFSTAMKGYEPQSMSTVWDWATKYPPAGQEKTRQDAAARRQELMNMRSPQ